jgi:ribosomal protein S27E
MPYVPKLRRIKVRCNKCNSVPQAVESVTQKTRRCAFCSHVIDVQKNIVKKEVW